MAPVLGSGTTLAPCREKNTPDNSRLRQAFSPCRTTRRRRCATAVIHGREAAEGETGAVHAAFATVAEGIWSTNGCCCTRRAMAATTRSAMRGGSSSGHCDTADGVTPIARARSDGRGPRTARASDLSMLTC